jgi:hypothetical protein
MSYTTIVNMGLVLKECYLDIWAKILNMMSLDLVDKIIAIKQTAINFLGWAGVSQTIPIKDAFINCFYISNRTTYHVVSYSIFARYWPV